MTSSNNIKMAFNNSVKAIGVITSFSASDEDRLRLVISNAGVTNTIVIKGQLQGQDDWDTIQTIVGNSKVVALINIYDIISVECTVYDSLSDHVKVIASSFNVAGRATSIGAPVGDLIQDADQINFISSNSSVTITTNSTNKTIDLVSNGVPSPSIKHIKTVALVDWIGPSAGLYILAIPFSIHAVVNPTVTCFETNGATFDQVLVAVNLDASYNIIITVPQTPDSRFIGKIVIE